MTEEKVIYLYIKESPLGLKYLGQTTCNPFNYPGSGKHWKRHLKKHNLLPKDIKTTILFETTDRSKIKEIGIYYSNLYNVVESKEWANLMPETGEHSTLGYKHTQENIEKFRLNSTGRKISEETREKLRNMNKGRPKTQKQKESAANVWKGKKLPEYITKAMKDAISIKVINKETGEEFSSIKEAADSVDIYLSTLRHYLRWDKEGCKFKYKDEELNIQAKNRRLQRIEKQPYRNNKNIPTKSSKFVGVYFDKSRNKWTATIRTKLKRLHIGRFNSEEEAGLAYEKAFNELREKLIVEYKEN